MIPTEGTQELARGSPRRRTLSRVLLRPYALAGRPAELPLAAACIVLLSLVFVGDILTPVQIAVSALGLIPLLAAMWLLSWRLAWAVGAVAIGQLIVTGALGTLSLPTIAAEGSAYIVLALVCRLYAATIAKLFFGAAAQNGSPEGQTPWLSLTLTVGGRRSARGLDNLTERERQVTRLAARGYTAREIGDELHIGRRTVETHLANAYDKLGVRSKRELVRAASGAEAASSTSKSLR